MRSVMTPLLLAALLPLGGCGQSGSLYFDEAPPADQLPPSRKQAAASMVPVPVENPAPAAEAPAAEIPAGKVPAENAPAEKKAP